MRSLCLAATVREEIICQINLLFLNANPEELFKYFSNFRAFFFARKLACHPNPL